MPKANARKNMKDREQAYVALPVSWLTPSLDSAVVELSLETRAETEVLRITSTQLGPFFSRPPANGAFFAAEAMPAGYLESRMYCPAKIMKDGSLLIAGKIIGSRVNGSRFRLDSNVFIGGVDRNKDFRQEGLRDVFVFPSLEKARKACAMSFPVSMISVSLGEALRTGTGKASDELEALGLDDLENAWEHMTENDSVGELLSHAVDGLDIGDMPEEVIDKLFEEDDADDIKFADGFPTFRN